MNRRQKDLLKRLQDVEPNARPLTHPDPTAPSQFRQLPWDACFQEIEGVLCLYWNDEHSSTHICKEEVG